MAKGILIKMIKMKTTRFMEDLDLRELKRLQQLSANKLSEASLKGDRDGIIMWYNAYREKEGEIYDLEIRLYSNRRL